ncbi:MAG: hypothetical protein H6Q65_1389 [Firmicutes bacterium]|nr:hypothetical protein [Bacillota bacterium]
MTYGLTLIAILAIMGGFIAYIGDKLGTKVGKRRLSLFGLRPKYTSIIVTIITGILIAASTLGVLSVASENVRTALFGMQALKTELNSLTDEVAVKNAELETGRAALAARTAEYAALTVKVSETSRQLAEINEELLVAIAERDTTAAALQQVQENYTAAQADLDKSHAEIAALQATKNQLDGRVDELTKARTTLQADVDSLTKLTENLKKGIQVVREGTVVFRAGEVLGMAVVPGGQPADESEKTINAVLYQTNQNLLSRLNVKDKELAVLWISKSEVEKAVSQLAGSVGDTIVRVSASGNIVYGEPVLGRLEFFPNKLIYTQDQIIHSESLQVGDARETEEAVLQFLQKVNAAAVRKGMLPDPLQGTVGMMSGAQLFETVNKVQKLGGKVLITAQAKEDTYTAGPLQVELVVKELL